MSLSVAYNTARSALQASQSQMAIVSRNTAGASDPNYSKKIASLTTQGGAARITVTRASDLALYIKMLDTTSDAASRKALLEGLEKLSQTIGDTELDESPAARVGALNAALQQYAKSPDNPTVAKAFVTAAKDMAKSLNDATSSVQAIRQEADSRIADSVNRINDLLKKYEAANNDVMRGYAVGADVSDALDARDSLISQLSEEVGLTVVPRTGGDVALYTDSGVPLFERTARTVSFSQTTVYGPGVTGQAVFIDGVQVTGAGAPMPLNSGSLVGLTSLRDDVTVTYQQQLDEMARGLIEAFAEVDKSGALDDMPGVFTYTGATGIPTIADTAATPGLAGLIKVNEKIDPTKTDPVTGLPGSYDLIRDGGINGTAYVYNAPDAGGSVNAAYSDRLYDLADAMAADRPFKDTLGFGASANLQNFASFSASWVEASRQSASSSLDYQNTLLGHASEALSNATDVNIDEETALMLQLEKSYSASAKLISIIDQMLQTILNAVG